MAKELPQIALTAIDVDSVADVEENQEACAFELILNEAPDEDWVDEFDYWYKQAPYPIKPPVSFSNNRMHIVYMPRYSEELQGYLGFLAGITQHANDEVRRTAEILTTDAKERRKTDFRNLLRRMSLPQRPAAY